MEPENSDLSEDEQKRRPSFVRERDESTDPIADAILSLQDLSEAEQDRAVIMLTPTRRSLLSKRGITAETVRKFVLSAPIQENAHAQNFEFDAFSAQFDWRLTAPRLKLSKFFPPEGFAQLVADMVEQGHLTDTFRRYLHWFLVHGSSGRGKTRLALEACAAATGSLASSGFPCGVTYIRLSPGWDTLAGPGLPYDGCLLLARVLSTHASPSDQSRSRFDSTQTLENIVIRLRSETQETRRFLILDEIQTCPLAVSAILRAVSMWNDPTTVGAPDLSQPRSGPSQPKHGLMFIPVCVGTTFIGLNHVDLAQATGYTPISYCTPFLLSGGNALLDVILNDLQRTSVDPTYLRYLVGTFGGWPMAFEVLFGVLEQCTGDIESFESCRTAYEHVCRILDNRYHRDEPTRQPLKKVLLHAARDIPVDPKSRLNGVTWEEAEKAGWFSLARHPSAVTSGDEPSVTVQIPLLLWTLANNRLKLCDPVVLNPFNRDYDVHERLAIASFQLALSFAGAGLGSSYVRDVRAGASFTPQTGDIHLNPVEVRGTLSAHLSTYISSWQKDVCMPVRLGQDSKEFDLIEGGLIRGNRTQPDVDFVAFIPRFLHHPSVLYVSQHKYQDVVDDRSGRATESKQSVPDIHRFTEEMVKMYSPFADVVICEWFTDKRLSQQSFQGPLDNEVIVFEGNYKSVLGPILSQHRLEMRSDLQESAPLV